MAKQSRSRSGSGGGRRASSARRQGNGWLRGILWLVVIGLLGVIARYAYIGAQPDKRCYTLLAHRAGCDRPTDYSDRDRAKLEDIIEKTVSKP